MNDSELQQPSTTNFLTEKGSIEQPFQADSQSNSACQNKSPKFMFLNRLPLEKMVIWSGFLTIIYVLRHFFFVIFLTFLLSYSMRLLVVRLCRPFSGRKRAAWIETIVAFFCFLTLVVALYRVGSLILPELARQGQALAKRVASPERSPQAQFDEFLTDTVGRWLFQQNYGDTNSSEYKTAYELFRAPELQREHFRELMSSVERSFDDYLVEHLSSYELTPLANTTRSGITLEEWVLKNRAPQELELDRDRYVSLWEAFYKKQQFQIPGLRDLKFLSHSEREEAILRFVTSSLLADETSLAPLKADWEVGQLRIKAERFRQERPQEAERYFATFYPKSEAKTTYKLDDYLKLKEAAFGSIAEFRDTFNSLNPYQESEKERETRERELFERSERRSLYAKWKEGELAGKLQEKLEEHILALMSSIGSVIGQLVPKLLLFPMQLFTALLLSFLITIDVPRLRAGLEKLSTTRFKHIYWEIKPGLVSFGLLIGRAFQAQGMIAIVNSILTFGAIHLLGIQNAAFLCFIVFLCSFIPVLGVVFSSVPIAVMALTQEGGSFMLAVWSIVAILLIHFLETSVLNPRILGNMLHLHPVLVLAILAICEHFFGVWGLLLGVPVFVYIIRFVILQEGIPGFIEMPRSISSQQDKK